jgi:predicted nucleic acid-binding protein
MQKIIVSDTSCIGYLIQINLLHLLQTLYGEIIIPAAVNDEILQLENKEHTLSEFKNADWIKIYSTHNLSNVSKYKNILDRGELEAISIAIELEADLLIIDEKLSRVVATTIGFDITGLVGILITAKNKNLILSVKKALDELILLGCRISNTLYNIALKSCNEQ